MRAALFNGTGTLELGDVDVADPGPGRAGRELDLESLITARRPDEINEGFADLGAGVGVRTVIDLEAT